MLSPNGRDEPGGGAIPADRDADVEDLTALRDVIVGPERQRLAALQARLDDPEARAHDVGEVLPQVLLQHAQDPHFARALTPPLEKALTAAVRRDPKPMADALFPVMGPAIRKAVAAALSGMVDSFNRAIEHSLSWRSLQWRLEARRTGRSFGEVVLLKTLVYRVEQVFLIDRRTGLLLQHVQHDAGQVQDADMVSGMLTAIRDFAQDSFKLSDADSLESLTVGDLSVWIEAGPLAFIAAVIRGTAPREYRQTLQSAVEEVHLRFGDALQSFSGDATTVADARSVLEGCLGMRYRADERKPRPRAAWIVVGVVVLALAVWGVLAYRSQQRWSRYLDALRAEPGIVVVSTAREGGQYVVTGLRDPLARDPQTLLAQAGLDETAVAGRWSAYQSLDPGIVQARANAELAAPVRDTVASIESTAILFVKGVAKPAADQQATLERVIAAVGKLEGLAAVTNTRYRLAIVGHTDADGPPESNVPLSRARADAVAAAIAAAVGPHVTVTASGVGSTEPAVTGQTENDNRQNRRVTIRVTALSAR
ncbi:MAG TPA: OmpA family protein [Vicinamibacterales bacterium]|nr:OmpA family protein [Vicinamibacterales bacterium]